MLALVLTVGFSSLRGQTDQELYEKAFGRLPEGSSQPLAAPLIVDQQHAGELTVIFRVDGQVESFQAAPLLRALEPLCIAATLNRLRAGVDSAGMLTFEQVRQAGLHASYQDARGEVSVVVPAQLRKPSTISLRDLRPTAVGESVLSPSHVSGYLNIQSAFDFVELSGPNLPTGFMGLRLDLSGAVNLWDWVVEGNAFYLEDASQRWQRGNVRLLHDDTDRLLRLAFGDVTYPTAGFQNAQPLLGMGLARDFTLQPFRPRQPLGHTTFFLDQPSIVEILVNGYTTQTLRLPAGQHTIQDFYLNNGPNDVVLRITDPVGRLRIIEDSFFTDFRLLSREESEFSYNLGFPRESNTAERSYDLDLATASLFHRFGFTNALTMGGNLQVNSQQQLLGLEAIFNAVGGIFQLDAAVSLQDRADVAARGQFRISDARPDAPWSGILTASAQYTGRSFAALGNLAPNNRYAVDLSLRYSSHLPGGFTGSLGGTYRVGRDGTADATRIDLALGRRLTRNLSANLTLSRLDFPPDEPVYGAFIAFTLQFAGAQSSQGVATSFDTFTDATRTDWYYSPRRNVGAVSAAGSLQRDPLGQRMSTAVGYRSHRFDATVNQDVATDSSGHEVNTRTSVHLGTALLWADGVWAISRPVQESFAIIAGHPDYHGIQFLVNPDRSGGSAAASGALGPAVLPDLRAYVPRNIAVEAPDLPLGFELGADHFTLLPTYRSGTLIRVGTGATILLQSLLQNPQGAVMPFIAGSIVSLDEPTLLPLLFFTDGKGRFFAEGLKPGRWELLAAGWPQHHALLDFPVTAGVFELDFIRLAVRDGASLQPEGATTTSPAAPPSAAQ